MLSSRGVIRGATGGQIAPVSIIFLVGGCNSDAQACVAILKGALQKVEEQTSTTAAGVLQEELEQALAALKDHREEKTRSVCVHVRACFVPGYGARKGPGRLRISSEPVWCVGTKSPSVGVTC